MREGNCCDSCKAGTYNPDKSYALASWQDYMEWLTRLGYQVSFRRNPHSVIVTVDQGEHVTFTTKKEIFEFLIGDDVDE